ncbi:hypothetical protein ACE3MQ_17730 [Paenibacillus lentus]|uniref:hypothetical protein n=1 Tax=Paenibacillus lentus TaxID=1338368 RepID=UPI0036673CC9
MTENSKYPKTEAADHEYERYQVLREYRPENDVPSDDLLPHDTRITQALSEDDSRDSKDVERENNEFPDVPDADDIAENSPVDPVAPDPNGMPGIDVLNGYSGEDDDSPRS